MRMARKRSRVEATAVVQGAKVLAANGGALAPNEQRLNFGERWSYAPAPEQSDYFKIKPRYRLFIDGKFRAPHSGVHFDSSNPATEGKLAEFAEADASTLTARCGPRGVRIPRSGAGCPRPATAEQISGMPGVFGRDEIDATQNLQRALRDVVEVTNRGADDVKHGGLSRARGGK